MYTGLAGCHIGITAGYSDPKPFCLTVNHNIISAQFGGLRVGDIVDLQIRPPTHQVGIVPC
jgi:hypothetical protein